ncbi:immunity 42 family protein [Brevibacillus ruminantium]|uniref:Immunity 42 family protein n=1 Tax=Brevibacillus ruminantium TaxID=2950604 RepID=A0ABY4WCK1_9BACL|nr:immunity 42 family protein [Brevibacillus ruminantium]USG64629.1 immunity 42 family protein [Brevibacillus ruminantium]
MIVGKRERFAIEFELDKDCGGVWLFGRFCYWIANKKIGDYEMGTSLRDVLFALDTIKNDAGNRVSNPLFNLDATMLYNYLNEELYGSSESSADNTMVIEEACARFNITLPVDIFDLWKIFLVENLEESRLLFKKIDSEDWQQVYEIYLKKGEFDEVVIKAHNELDDIYNDELRKNK